MVVELSAEKVDCSKAVQGSNTRATSDSVMVRLALRASQWAARNFLLPKNCQGSLLFILFVQLITKYHCIWKQTLHLMPMYQPECWSWFFLLAAISRIFWPEPHSVVLIMSEHSLVSRTSLGTGAICIGHHTYHNRAPALPAGDEVQHHGDGDMGQQGGQVEQPQHHQLIQGLDCDDVGLAVGADHPEHHPCANVQQKRQGEGRQHQVGLPQTDGDVLVLIAQQLDLRALCPVVALLQFADVGLSLCHEDEGSRIEGQLQARQNSIAQPMALPALDPAHRLHHQQINYSCQGCHCHCHHQCSHPPELPLSDLAGTDQVEPGVGVGQQPVAVHLQHQHGQVNILGLVLTGSPCQQHSGAGVDDQWQQLEAIVLAPVVLDQGAQ